MRSQKQKSEEMYKKEKYFFEKEEIFKTSEEKIFF